MQLQFEKEEVVCLRNLLTQVQTLEQTQEISVDEGRDGGEILGVWGQVLLRTKERQGDNLRITGGIPARVLLAGTQGQEPACLETWIPFRLDWDLPEDTGDETARVLPVLTGLDARWTGAGKLLIRAWISAMAECWQKTMVSLRKPLAVPQDVALQQKRWPVWMTKETGEKSISLEETLILPSSAPAVEKILYYHMMPGITERKVLGDKIVFRGSANLHLCYLCAEGKVRSWDMEIPFSQYAELTGNYTPDARAQVLSAVTRLELEQAEEGELMLRAGMTGQYLVEERQLLETVTDAYSPRRQVEAVRENLSLPVVLEERRDILRTEQPLPLAPDGMADMAVLTDLPRMGRQGDRTSLEVPQRARMLYYDDEGVLRSTERRWSQSLELETEENSRITAFPEPARIRQLPGMEHGVLEMELPVMVRTLDGSGLPAVTALTLGEPEMPDPGRPSLILRRAGTDTLWDIARNSGSTVEAICSVNGLEGEPEPERMLLIPVI